MIINKIKKFRKVKNLTQDDLAKELGVTRKTINQIESGNVLPKIDVAYKLSIILGATVEQLFLNDDYNKSPIWLIYDNVLSAGIWKCPKLNI